MNDVKETLTAIKAALTAPKVADTIAKTAATGALTTGAAGANLIWYDLTPVAKILVPGYTPLRNMLPREAGDGGTATHWNGITNVNAGANNVGVSEGNRNAYNTTTTKSYTATYKTIGMDDYVTFELDEASKNFDDAKAIAVNNLLLSYMLEEEAALLGANNSIAFGTAATPAGVDNSADGGAIPESTNVVISVLYLTNEGWRLSSAAGSNVTFFTCTSASTLPARAARTNADGSTSDANTGYTGLISSATTVTTATDGDNTHTVSVTVTPALASSNNAAIAGYAWFWGATSGAAQKLGAITTVPSYKIKIAAGLAAQTAATTIFSTDYSQDTKIFDGLISIIAGAGPEDSASVSGATIDTLAVGTAGTGTALTSDGGAGITEINTLLKEMWATYRLSPTDMWCGGPVMTDIKNLVIGGGGAPLFRFNVDASSAQQLASGILAGSVVVGQYLNPFGIGMEGSGQGNLVKVHLHPFLAPGKILFTSSKIPYKMANIGNPLVVKCRRDTYQIEYPITTRKYTYGIYSSEVLQCWAPISLGMITNIASTN